MLASPAARVEPRRAARYVRSVRVLVVSSPAEGHLNPILPMAVAFRDAGDDVVVAGAASVVQRADEAGLVGHRAGPEMSVWQERLQSRVRGFPGDGLAPDRILLYFLPRLFGEVGAPLMADDLVPFVAEFRPDIVYFESGAFAAPLAAATTGALPVNHSILRLPDVAVFELVGDAVSSLWRSFGVDPRLLAGVFDGLTVSPWPASLDSPPGYDQRRIRRVASVADDGGASQQLPSWAGTLPHPSTVYATLGTVTNTDLNVFRAVLDGLATEPVNVIVTVGANNDPADLAPIPANARVERYIPQSLLLPICAAAVTHGGSGTTLAASAAGLPQLIIPQGADQFTNATCCIAAGFARQLLPDEVSGDAVRAAVRGLLDEPEPRVAAARVASEMTAMSDPGGVIDEIHTLAAR